MIPAINQLQHLWYAVPAPATLISGIACGFYGVAGRRPKQRSIATFSAGLLLTAYAARGMSVASLAAGGVLLYMGVQSWPRLSNMSWCYHNPKTAKELMCELKGLELFDYLITLKVAWEKGCKAARKAVRKRYNLTSNDLKGKILSSQNSFEKQVYEREIKTSLKELMACCEMFSDVRLSLPDRAFSSYTLPLMPRWFLWKVKGGQLDRELFERLYEHLAARPREWFQFIPQCFPKLTEHAYWGQYLQRAQLAPSKSFPLLTEINGYLQNPSVSDLTLVMYPDRDVKSIHAILGIGERENPEGALKRIKLYCQVDWKFFIEMPTIPNSPTKARQLFNLRAYASLLKKGVLTRFFQQAGQTATSLIEKFGVKDGNEKRYLRWLCHQQHIFTHGV